jgi:hypothetical protein
LGHCATNREVAGSIPDCFAGIFQCHKISGRIMTLGSSQPVTEMSTRNITTLLYRLSRNLGALTSWIALIFTIVQTAF